MVNMLPSEADAAVRRLSSDRLRVEADGHGVYLVHVAENKKLRLLSNQLTSEGLAQAIAEIDPWPKG